MYEAEFEFEAELEDLMSVLAENNLESEAEWTPAQARDLAERQFIPYLISTGMTDENAIADMVFYQLHPEWKAKKLPQDNNPAHQVLIQEWLSIRDAALRQLRKPPLQGQSPAPVAVPTINVNDRTRFLKDLTQLEALVASTPDPRNWRYQCWFSKLKQPDADDRVIRWGSICPTVGVYPGVILGPCEITEGWVGPQQAQQLSQNIRSVTDVDTAGPSLGIITNLKFQIMLSVEMSIDPLVGLRWEHDTIHRAIEKLDKWANIGIGGSSSMGREYVAIKDWIGGRQKDPRSVYSCL
jgi:hypothetical protein